MLNRNKDLLLPCMDTSFDCLAHMQRPDKILYFSRCESLTERKLCQWGILWHRKLRSPWYTQVREICKATASITVLGVRNWGLHRNTSYYWERTLVERLCYNLYTGAASDQVNSIFCLMPLKGLFLLQTCCLPPPPFGCFPALSFHFYRHFHQKMWSQVLLSAIHVQPCRVVCMKMKKKLRTHIFQGKQVLCSGN